jgi:hypothetical protein
VFLKKERKKDEVSSVRRAREEGKEEGKPSNMYLANSGLHKLSETSLPQSINQDINENTNQSINQLVHEKKDWLTRFPPLSSGSQQSQGREDST